MLKTAVSNSIDLPATNCFTCNCSRSVRKANMKQIPFMQMSSSLSAPAAPVCQDTHNHSHISSSVHGSINSGLGMEYAFRLPPAQPFTSCGFEQASHMNLSQPCCLSRLDNNANVENFCPNIDLNTNTFTNTSHCVCKRKQQKQNKHNKINDVKSISSINSNINGISDSGFIVNVPKSKIANKNGPGFDSIRKKDGCWIKPNYYNRYTSCVIENTPDQVINGLLIICAHYGSENQSENGSGGGNGGSVFEDKQLDDSSSTSINTFSREIEYRLNKQDFIIDGIVFVKHKPIKFQISVWHDSDDMDTFSPVRVEFQKTRGDSALFHLFWSEMLELMETFTLENNKNTNNNNNNNRLFGTISDCTRSGNSCLETFLLPMPLPKLPKQENKKFTEIDGTSEEDIQDSQMNKEKQNDDLANKINFNNENEKEKEQMQEQQLNDDFMDDTIGGMSIDLESEYKYTKGDLDDMVLDLISNYRDEALDVLATICNTLENNLQFRKLFCQHNKIIETIGSVIINKQNYNNMAKLRGGLCVLLKLIGKKTVEPEPQSQLATQKLQDIQETAEELEKRLQLETPPTATTATITTLTTNKLAKIASHEQDTTQPANSPAKQQQRRKKLLGFDLSYLDVTRLNFNGTIKEESDVFTPLIHDASEDNNKIENESESESEIGNAYEEKAGGSEVESVIECLVNETNILKEFPLLLQNSSKIVQNHTIRLMNSMFEYIPEKLKLTKNVTDKIIFLNSHDK